MMGQFTSKLLQDIIETTDQPGTLVRPGTPMPRHKILEFDPRSPSEEISRTPILVESTPDQKKLKNTCEKRNTLKSTYVKTYLETDFDDPIVSKMVEKKHILDKKCMKVSKLQGLDPRSPTIGIDRTPIQVESRLVNKKKQEGLEQLNVATKISSVSQYLETDMDSLLKKPMSCDVEDIGDVSEVNKEDKVSDLHSLDCDPRSPSVEMSRTPILVANIPGQNKATHKHFEPYIHHDDGPENATEADVEGLVADVLELMQDRTGEVMQQENTPPKETPKLDKDIRKKKLFRTPDSKCASSKTGLGFKVRTPLGVRSANDNSSHQLLRIVQSRGMHQEIDRLSIIDANENMPPMSLMSQNSMAQQIGKKQIVNWDNDATVII